MGAAWYRPCTHKSSLVSSGWAVFRFSPLRADVGRRIQVSIWLSVYEYPTVPFDRGSGGHLTVEFFLLRCDCLEMGPFALLEVMTAVGGKDACRKHRKRCVKHAFRYLPGGCP